MIRAGKVAAATTISIVTALAGGAASRAATPQPEEPVGPASYHGVRFAAPPTADTAEPRSSAAPYGGKPLVLQSSYVGRNAAEPTLGVDAKGVAFYAASTFDGLGGLSARTEVLRSSNGRVWENVTPSLFGQDTPPDTLDPYVYVDQISGRVFSIDLQLAGSYLSYSDDEGASWQPSAIAAPGVNDHQTLFAGPPPAGVATKDGYPTISYYCVNALAAVTCSRTLDGGKTFEPLASQPYSGCVGCQTGHGEVDSQGRVFLPRGEYLTVDGERLGNFMAVSEDGGKSWSTVDITPGMAPAGRHTAMAIDRAGNVYYVFWDKQWLLPWLVTSTDHGQTWSKPLMVAPPGVHDVNFPEIVAGERGGVAIAFPGSTVPDQDDETRPWHAFMTISTNALDEDPVFVSNTANPPGDPIHRGACTNRCKGMFDFIETSVSPADGKAWASITDTCTAKDDCNSPERVAGRATDAEGTAIRELSGPRLTRRRPRRQP